MAYISSTILTCSSNSKPHRGSAQGQGPHPLDLPLGTLLPPPRLPDQPPQSLSSTWPRHHGEPHPQTAQSPPVARGGSSRGASGVIMEAPRGYMQHSGGGEHKYHPEDTRVHPQPPIDNRHFKAGFDIRERQQYEQEMFLSRGVELRGGQQRDFKQPRQQQQQRPAQQPPRPSQQQQQPPPPDPRMLQDYRYREQPQQPPRQNRENSHSHPAPSPQAAGSHPPHPPPTSGISSQAPQAQKRLTAANLIDAIITHQINRTGSENNGTTQQVPPASSTTNILSQLESDNNSSPSSSSSSSFKPSHPMPPATTTSAPSVPSSSADKPLPWQHTHPAAGFKCRDARQQ